MMYAPVSNQKQLIREFCKVIHDHFGIVLSEKKYLLIRGRLSRRAAELGHSGLESYLRFVIRDPAELKVCGELLATHTTQWFREIIHFQWLRPRLREVVQLKGKVSIWSGACSTGEEVYSLMFLCLLEGLHPEQFRILGSDVSERVLKTAVEMPDTDEFQKQVLRLKQKLGSSVSGVEERVQQAIRQSVKFRQYNLMDSEWASTLQFDFIFLRNVLIYFDAPTIASVCSKLSRHLYPDGHLLLGLSESVRADEIALKSLGDSIYRLSSTATITGNEAVEPLPLEAPVVADVSEVIVESVPEPNVEPETPRKSEAVAVQETPAFLAPIRQKIRLLLVEDSLSMRKILRTIYERIPDVEVVGETGSWESAAKLFKELKPNFVSLDMKLDDGTGNDFLRSVAVLPSFQKSKILLLTDCGASDGPMVMDALALGARYYIQKPKSGELREFWPMLNEFVCGLFTETKSAETYQSLTAEEILNREHKTDFILIGSSTGGTEVVRQFIARLPRNCPPILVVQHMPETFTGVYAQRMQQTTGRPVYEVRSEMKIQWGSAYIASGGMHLQLTKKNGGFFVDANDGVPVNRFKPSVSVLFSSAQALGIASRSVAIMLTGMGRDGAEEMVHLKKAGALTLAQSRETCAVYGMPAAAVESGAVDYVDSPEGMISLLGRLFDQNGIKNAS
jgi:two-component system chemotaxis response regulator CheB